MIDSLKAVQWSGKADPECNGLNGYPEHPAVDPFYCVFNYQPFDNLIEEIDFTRAFVELNGPLGEMANYHLEALWSESVMPKWQTQPSHPPFPLLHLGVMEIAPDHPNRVAFLRRRRLQPGLQSRMRQREKLVLARAALWQWRPGSHCSSGIPHLAGRRRCGRAIHRPRRTRHVL